MGRPAPGGAGAAGGCCSCWCRGCSASGDEPADAAAAVPSRRRRRRPPPADDHDEPVDGAAAGAAARGGAVPDPRGARRAVHAGRAVGRQGRLPLLPARPAPGGRHLRHRHRRAAGQRRRRPPRDPVHGRARTRWPRPRRTTRRRRAAAGPASAAPRCPTGRPTAVRALDSAPWLAAWAPGGGEAVFGKGTGKFAREGQPGHPAGPLQPARGHRAGPDRGAAPAGPAAAPTSRRCRRCCSSRRSSCPACRASPAPLCDRDRRGQRPGPPVRRRRRAHRRRPPAALRRQLRRARGPARPSTATAGSTQDMQVRAVAGHMHLLGRSISVTLDPGRAARAHAAQPAGLGLRRPGRDAAAQAGPGAGRRHPAGHLHATTPRCAA